MSLTIALTYDLKTDYKVVSDLPSDELAEFDDEETIADVERTMIELGHKPIRVGNLFKLVQALATNEHNSWDLVWNVVEGYHGTAREAQVPGLLEAWQIPSIFSNAATLAIIHDKVLTKVVLANHGVATAPFVAIRWQDTFHDLSTEEWQTLFSQKKAGAQIFSPGLPAVFVKPSMEGSSKGIYAFNKACSTEELNTAIRKLQQRFPNQDLLVEPFLQGREFTVSLLGSGRKARVLGTIEHRFKAGSATDFMGYDLKWDDDHSQAMINCAEDTSFDLLVKAAETLGLEAWRTMGCYDAGRVDIRCQELGKHAQPFVLEVC